MNQEANFMEELLNEVELKEEQQTEAYMDLLIAKIGHLEGKIASIFKSAEEEVKIINDFALSKNSKIQGQIDGCTNILEAYMRDQNEKDNNIKTISLAHGCLKLHKKADKVEITDMESFLSKASSSMLTVVQESVKPSVQKIKQYIKMSGRIPLGVTKSVGSDEFKLTINNNKEM